MRYGAVRYVLRKRRGTEYPLLFLKKMRRTTLTF